MLSIDKFKELVDPCLADAYDEEQMKILALTAALCIDQSPIERPHMNQVGFLYMKHLDKNYFVAKEEGVG